MNIAAKHTTTCLPFAKEDALTICLAVLFSDGVIAVSVFVSDESTFLQCSCVLVVHPGNESVFNLNPEAFLLPGSDP